MPEKKDRDYYPLINKKGKANFFLDSDKIHIYSWEGEPVAFVEKGAVFTFDKKHLGFYEEGWLRDKNGKCVAMVEPAGPMGPNPPKTKHREPPGEKKEAPPLPEIKELPPKPLKKAAWSNLSDKDFFSGKK